MTKNGQLLNKKLSDFGLLALDMDGTSLNSKGKLSQGLVNFINTSNLDYLTIIFATGRMPMAVHNSLNQLNISKVVVSHNGALISNLETGEIYHSSTLSQEIVDFAIKLHTENFIPLHLNLPDKVITDVLTRQSIDYANHLEIQIEEVYLDQVKETVISLLFIGKKEELKLILKQFEDQFKNFSFVLIPDKEHWLLQLLPQNTSKGSGMIALANKLGIPKDRIISFGDSYNDLEMLENSGLSVAMGNACEELKEVADIVTKTNDEDGVLSVLNKLSFQNE